MVEGAPLLREYGLKAHRGFESLSLRQLNRPAKAGLFNWRRDEFDKSLTRDQANEIFKRLKSLSSTFCGSSSRMPGSDSMLTLTLSAKSQISALLQPNPVSYGDTNRRC